jgi:hypothetical protein
VEDLDARFEGHVDGVEDLDARVEGHECELSHTEAR